MPDDTIRDAIEEAAASPARVAVDGTVVEGQSIRDLIEADKYLAQKSAATRNHLGVSFRKLIPSPTP